jgi:hypothetical protein
MMKKSDMLHQSTGPKVLCSESQMEEPCEVRGEQEDANEWEALLEPCPTFRCISEYGDEDSLYHMVLTSQIQPKRPILAGDRSGIGRKWNGKREQKREYVLPQRWQIKEGGPFDVGNGIMISK